MNMIKIKLPEYIEEAVYQIESKGFEAFVVGGAVRDALLGMEPSDWDIATNALPEVVKSIFSHHYDTGIKHGTVTVLVNEIPIEITTYRKEGKYTDFRRPESVTFSGSLEDDLKRRDFTINALAYNNTSGIVDISSGIDDLKHGIIRCIGDPAERLSEDALRMLRAVRLSLLLDFKIEDQTYDAICSFANLLNKISAERICEELTKIIMSDKGVELLFETGISDVILPEVSKCFGIWQNNLKHIYDVGNHTLEVLYNTPKTPLLRYCALLHDVGKVKAKITDRWGVTHFPNHASASATIARSILTRLKMSNKHKDIIVNLIKMHSVRIKPNALSVRKIASKLGIDRFYDLLTLKRANIMAQNPKYAEERLEELDAVEEIFKEIIKSNCPLSIKDLAVDGNDMKALGLAGSEIGRMLRFLLAETIKNPRLNTPEQLVKLAKESKNTRKKQ